MIKQMQTTEAPRKPAHDSQSSVASPLRQLLVRVGRINALLTAAAWLLAITAGLALVVMVAITLDAWLALGGLTRGLLLLCCVAVLCALLPILIRRARRRMVDPMQIACEVQTRAGIAHSRLINAMQFQRQSRTTAGDVQDERLRSEAVRRGEAAARDIPLWRAVDWQPTLAMLIVAAGLLAALMAHVVITPQTYQAAAPRWLMPWADLPAYTPVQFDVAVTQHPQEPSLRQVVALVDAADLPEAADIVWHRDDENAPPLRIAMWPTRAGHFTAPADAKMSGRFYIDTTRGRSRWYDIKTVASGIDSVQATSRINQLAADADAAAKQQADFAADAAQLSNADELLAAAALQQRILQRWRAVTARLESHLTFEKAAAGMAADDELVRMMNQAQQDVQFAAADATRAMQRGSASDGAASAGEAAEAMQKFLLGAQQLATSAGRPASSGTSQARQSASTPQSSGGAESGSENSISQNSRGSLSVVESSGPQSGGSGGQPSSGPGATGSAIGREGGAAAGVIMAESGVEKARTQDEPGARRAISDLDRRAIPAEHRELTEAYFERLRQRSR